MCRVFIRLKVRFHELVELFHVHLVLVGVLEALHRLAVVLHQRAILQHTGHQTHAAADVAPRLGLGAGIRQHRQQQQRDHHTGDLLFGVDAIHGLLRHHALLHHGLGELLLDTEQAGRLQHHGCHHEERKKRIDYADDQNTEISHFLPYSSCADWFLNMMRISLRAVAYSMWL